MTSTAAPVVKQYIPDFAVEEQDAEAIVAVLESIAASWTRVDAVAVAEVYTEDASIVLPGGVYLKGRTAIRDWLAAAFDGKWKGKHLLTVPLELRPIADDVCVLIAQGGPYQPGAREVSVDDAVRGVWVFRKSGLGWAVAAYGNTPVGATIPIPASQGAD